jgi:hypothetical protein
MAAVSVASTPTIDRRSRSQGGSDSMSGFPVGASIAEGRWTITEALFGGPDRGLFRASGEAAALVTMGAPQRRPRAELEARLALPVVGIAPLLAITTVIGEGVPYDVLVEREPPGEPVTRQRPASARAVGRELAEIVARAHASGVVLGALRPELVYSDGARCTGVAPRAETFLAGSAERSYGVPPCFDEVYLSPEALSLLPLTPASDVFSLCATLAYVLEGAPPFPGDTMLERMSAALRGAARAHALDPVIGEGLAADPSRRPTIDAIVAALSR